CHNRRVERSRRGDGVEQPHRGDAGRPDGGGGLARVGSLGDPSVSDGGCPMIPRRRESPRQVRWHPPVPGAAYVLLALALLLSLFDIPPCLVTLGALTGVHGLASLLVGGIPLEAPPSPVLLAGSRRVGAGADPRSPGRRGFPGPRRLASRDDPGAFLVSLGC